jgi:hypothetical protein
LIDLSTGGYIHVTVTVSPPPVYGGKSKYRQWVARRYNV